jgi:hypothetical protein
MADKTRKTRLELLAEFAAAPSNALFPQAYTAGRVGAFHFLESATVSSITRRTMWRGSSSTDLYVLRLKLARSGGYWRVSS